MSGYQGDGGTPTPPACVDCQFFRPTDEHVAMRCEHPRCKTFDIIRGTESMSPEHARRTGVGGFYVRGPCGPEGTLFEPLPPLTWWQQNFGLVMLCGVAVGFALLHFFGGN